MKAKFKLTSETKTWLGRTLFRIEALIDFGSVKTGDKGGFVETEKNLDHSGNAWVYGDAQVCGDARVSGDAQVYGNARVYGNAQVYGDAWVCGNARVCGDARVCGNAQVCGDARVYGNAWVSPINIIGLVYPITITDMHMQIGCERHLIADWAAFEDRRILNMDGKAALTFWRAHKSHLIAMCEATGRPLAEKASE